MRTILRLILACLTLATTTAHGQYDNVWAFGYHAGIDFNVTPPVPVLTSIKTNEGCASVCDAGGALLFYTDGHFVWDRNHQLMPSGSDLPGMGFNISWSTGQGALIMPVPGNSEQYYIFSLGTDEPGYLGGLYYSIVDMSLNNGLGDVMPEHRGKLISSQVTEHMTAIRGENCNIWLLTINHSLNLFHAYRVNSRGIDTIPVISKHIPGPPGINGGLGTMGVSPDRNYVAVAQRNLVLYDFDINTGKLTHPFELDNGGDNSYGVCFSSDNSKLYAAGGLVVQFDISVKDTNAVRASRVILGSGMGLRRAPNDKVYISTVQSPNSLHVIHKPNLKGLSCQYEKDGFILDSGMSSWLGLPNVIAKVGNFFSSSSTKDTLFCVDSFILRPLQPAGFNYYWNNGHTEPFLRIDTSGTYWVRYHSLNNECEIYTDTFQMVIYPVNRIYATKIVKDICLADTFTINTPNLATDYLWDNGSREKERKISQPGIYWVSYRNDSVCGQYKDSFIITAPEYKASFTSDSIVCLGQEIAFKNNSSASIGYFNWDFGDGNRDTAKHPRHTYIYADTYQVQLIGNIGKYCKDTFTYFVMVDTPSAFRFSMDRDEICVGELVHFNTLSDYKTSTLLWTFDDQNTEWANSGFAFQHAYDHAGVFRVQLTTLNRVCADSSFIDSVYVYPLPAIDLGPDTGLCLQDKGMDLHNLLPAPQCIYHNLWNTGDTTSGIKIKNKGTYSLTIVTEPIGCRSTESIIVDKDCYIDIPNVFTPNGDGWNDYFFPRQLLSQQVSRFRLQLFNRWGEVVFSTTAIDGRGWDGRYKGKDQPEGVYVYLLEAELAGKIQEQYQGNVSLLR